MEVRASAMQILHRPAELNAPWSTCKLSLLAQLYLRQALSQVAGRRRFIIGECTNALPGACMLVLSLPQLG